MARKKKKRENEGSVKNANKAYGYICIHFMHAGGAEYPYCLHYGKERG